MKSVIFYQYKFHYKDYNKIDNIHTNLKGYNYSFLALIYIFVVCLHIYIMFINLSKHTRVVRNTSFATKLLSSIKMLQDYFCMQQIFYYKKKM